MTLERARRCLAARWWGAADPFARPAIIADGSVSLMHARGRVDVGGMGAHPGDPRIAAHIESLSSRDEPDTDRLVSMMLRCCWPGGTGDRTESVALEWVRRWGPRRAGPVPPACSCATGRCPVCN